MAVHGVYTVTVGRVQTVEIEITHYYIFRRKRNYRPESRTFEVYTFYQYILGIRYIAKVGTAILFSLIGKRIVHLKAVCSVAVKHTAARYADI